MMTVNNEIQKSANKYEYVVRQWPGIEGKLDGTLTCDDASKAPLKIKWILCSREASG